MTTEEVNVKKLRKTVIPINFVKKNNGAWNHEQWLEFCETLKEKGYTPIDFDQVGLLLEKKKADYLAQKSS